MLSNKKLRELWTNSCNWDNPDFFFFIQVRCLWRFSFTQASQKSLVVDDWSTTGWFGSLKTIGLVFWESEREREALEHPCQIISFKNVELNDMILNSLMFYKYKSWKQSLTQSMCFDVPPLPILSYCVFQRINLTLSLFPLPFFPSISHYLSISAVCPFFSSSSSAPTNRQ